MKILIVNGSPAGENSITMQTVEYLKLLFPEHDYTTLHAGRKIRDIEKDFSETAAALRWAELILFAYPVYTFLVPSQLHRFLELMKENEVMLAGVYATQITTSKHFYDMTAHRFIEDFCADLKMRYVRGLSADMEDLLTEQGQKEARDFFRYLFWNIRHGLCESPSVEMQEPFIGVPVSEVRETKDKSRLHVALVTDYDPAHNNNPLLEMTQRFIKRLPGSCEVINLREFPFKGGCLGCFHCAVDGTCIYKDGFDCYLREHINGADAVVYAFTIRDHSMGSRFKLYDDRQFCNGHRTVTMGKPVGYLVNGKLGAEENLRTVIEARAQVGGNYLAGAASNETAPDAEIDRLVRRLVYAAGHHYTVPKNFYGVGGLKIFRDLIFEMQGLMKEDHRFYKEHGFYADFPQKKKGKIASMYLVSLLMNNRKLKQLGKTDFTEGMLMPYRAVLKKAVRSPGSPLF